MSTLITNKNRSENRSENKGGNRERSRSRSRSKSKNRNGGRIGGEEEDEKEVQQVLHSLKKRIQQKQTLRKNLVEFHDIIHQNQTEGLFDREDIEWIQQEIHRVEKEVQELECVYQKKKHLYTNSIAHLEHILQRRKRVLDQADQKLNIFAQCPYMLKKFSQKHVILMKTVNQMKHTFAHE